MIKCFFVDVKSISSNVPRSSFAESDLEKIADSILDVDGLIRPLILEKIGVEKYIVVDGHQEYYAAVIAKGKNINKAEMVNAFVIADNTRSAAILQLNLLKQSLTNTIATPIIDRHMLTEVLSSTIDRLLPAISAALSTQLEPIVTRLDEQKQILDIIKRSDLSSSNVAKSNAPEIREIKSLLDPVIEISESESSEDVNPKLPPRSKRKTKAKDISPPPNTVVNKNINPPDLSESEPVKTTKTTKSRKKSKTEDTMPVETVPSIESNRQPDIVVDSSVAITEPTKTIKADNLQGSIGLDKSTNALNLINTLDSIQLKIKLERSLIATAKTSGKLVEAIITNRSIQPAQKFESWDTIIDAKITGLGSVVIKKIIDKLK